LKTSHGRRGCLKTLEYRHIRGEESKIAKKNRHMIFEGSLIQYSDLSLR